MVVQLGNESESEVKEDDDVESSARTVSPSQHAEKRKKKRKKKTGKKAVAARSSEDGLDGGQCEVEESLRWVEESLGQPAAASQRGGEGRHSMDKVLAVENKVKY